MNACRAALFTLLGLLIITSPTLARELGDEAPPLKIKEWLKGDPVNLADGRGEKTYVIEFWATWCGPCIRGMPHVSAIQKKYGPQGVVVVGVTSKDQRQDLKFVKQWIKDLGFMMDYTVAFDDNHQTERAYMEAFNKKGIPQCFVIDKHGKIVWEGHPIFGLEEVIQAVLAGDYTIDKLNKIAAKAAEKKEQEFVARQKKMMEYFELVSSSGDPEQAAKLGREIIDRFAEDAHTLNEFAWTILTHEEITSRDHALALKAAKIANEAMRGKDASILDTYALALFRNGKVDEAIAAQKKALELAGDNKFLRAEFEARLKEFEAAKD